MIELRRFSSRRQRLDHAFLNQKLKDARSYRRIAGYFRSSIFELVGEEIAGISKVQVVCNSELDAADVLISNCVRGCWRGEILWTGCRRRGESRRKGPRGPGSTLASSRWAIPVSP